MPAIRSKHQKSPNDNHLRIALAVSALLSTQKVGRPSQCLDRSTDPCSFSFSPQLILLLCTHNFVLSLSLSLLPSVFLLTHKEPPKKTKEDERASKHQKVSSPLACSFSCTNRHEQPQHRLVCLPQPNPKLHQPRTDTQTHRHTETKKEAPRHRDTMCVCVCVCDKKRTKGERAGLVKHQPPMQERGLLGPSLLYSHSFFWPLSLSFFLSHTPHPHAPAHIHLHASIHRPKRANHLQPPCSPTPFSHHPAHQPSHTTFPFSSTKLLSHNNFFIVPPLSLSLPPTHTHTHTHTIGKSAPPKETPKST